MFLFVPFGRCPVVVFRSAKNEHEWHTCMHIVIVGLCFPDTHTPLRHSCYACIISSFSKCIVVSKAGMYRKAVDISVDAALEMLKLKGWKIHFYSINLVDSFLDYKIF
jgi:hypothetical protein